MRGLGVSLLVVSFVACGPEFGPMDQQEDVASTTSALTQVTGFGSNPGSLSLYIYEPANLASNRPLVVAMHGCTQSASAYAATGWNALADQYGFLVAYPQTTANNSCFDWFSSSQQSRSGAQVTSILQMVQHLISTKGIDSSRVYVTGLSAGGAMTNVLLAVAPDVFSRGAVMAGLPFACAATQSAAFTCMNSPPDQSPTQWGNLVRAAAGGHAAPRVSLWHGSSDTTVVPGNLTEEVDQWTDVNGIDTTVDRTTTLGSATRREFTDGTGTTLVESWTITGMNHGTPVNPPACGTAGAFILDVNLCSSAYAAAFFGLAELPDGGVVDSGVVDAGLGDSGIPDAGPRPDAGVDAGVDGGVVLNCLAEWYATNVNHFTAGRAVLCNGRYCAVGSGQLLGDSLDTTWVRQVTASRYEAGRCNATAIDGGTGGGGGSSTGGGGGSSTGGGGGSATGGGGGSATGGGSASGGGGGSATGGGGGSTATGGGGGSSVTGGGSGGGVSGGGTGSTGGGESGTGGGGGSSEEPRGCGCSSIDSGFAAIALVIAQLRRRRRVLSAA